MRAAAVIAAGMGVGTLSSPGEWANQQTLRWQAGPSVHITVQNLLGCSHVSNTYGVSTRGRHSIHVEGTLWTLLRLQWLRGAAACTSLPATD